MAIDIDIDAILKMSLGKKLALLTVLLLAIFAGYYKLYYTPKKEVLKNLETRLVEVQRKLEESRKAAKRLPKFMKEVDELNKNFKKVLTQLPDKKEIPSLLENVSTTGKNAGLEFLLFKPKTIVNRGFYAEVPVEVKVIGSYHNLASFFQGVGEMPRIVNISDLNIGNVKDNKGVIVLTTNFSATTFMFLSKEVGGGKGK